MFFLCNLKNKVSLHWKCCVVPCNCNSYTEGRDGGKVSLGLIVLGIQRREETVQSEIPPCKKKKEREQRWNFGRGGSSHALWEVVSFSSHSPDYRGVRWKCSPDRIQVLSSRSLGVRGTGWKPPSWSSQLLPSLTHVEFWERERPLQEQLEVWLSVPLPNHWVEIQLQFLWIVSPPNLSSRNTLQPFHLERFILSLKVRFR